MRLPHWLSILTVVALVLLPVQLLYHGNPADPMLIVVLVAAVVTAVGVYFSVRFAPGGYLLLLLVGLAVAVISLFRLAFPPAGLPQAFATLPWLLPVTIVDAALGVLVVVLAVITFRSPAGRRSQRRF